MTDQQYQETVALGWARLEWVRAEHGAAVHMRLVAGLVHAVGLAMGGHGGKFHAPMSQVAHMVGAMSMAHWNGGVTLAVGAEQDMVERRPHPTCGCEWCAKRREEVARGS